MHIYLTGFMGSGKTSVGRVLARRLGWRFVDLDESIERRAGMSVAEIFKDSGEAEFRRLESAELAAIPETVATVIATGGGTMIDPTNQRLMAERGQSVWLNAPLELIIDRLDGPRGLDRPLYGTHAELEKLFTSRVSIYEQSSQIVMIDAGSTIDEVADKVELVLGF